MARALDQIIREISASYNPLRDRATASYNKGVEDTAPQEQADLSGLEAAKSNAFESINTGANRRGMFFSGIPLAEQSKYVGENYLPAIAGLKNRYAGIRGNLYQTLSQQLGQYDTEAAARGQGVYQQELDRDEQTRQFNEQMAAQAARDSAARASGGGSSGGGGISFGPTDTPVPAKPVTPTVTVKPADQLLANQMFVKADGSLWSDNDLRSDYNATLASARNGNTRDQQKLRLYHSLRSDLFGTQAPIPLGAVKPATTGTQTSLPISNTVPTSNLLKPFGF